MGQMMNNLIKHPTTGWSQMTLSQLGFFSKGKGITKADLIKKGLPCIRYGEIYTLHHNTVEKIYSFISYNVAKKSKKLRFNDILFASSGETLEDIGKAVAYRLDKKVFAGGDIVILSLPEQYRADYIAYYLNSFGRSQLNKLGVGHSVVHIYAKDLGKVIVPIPPKNIQDKIVSTLEQWDTTIEKTEALIDAKERQFGWLQNTLIRANSDKWPTKPLNSLSHIKKGKQLNRDTLDDSGGYPVWNGGITPSGYTDKSNTVAKTITISEGGNSCGFVNFCKEDFWLGGHCYAIEKLDNSLDPDFLFFCLKANERRIMRLRVGSGLPNIQKKDIEKQQIQYPPINKQKRIAHTLNTAQQEITLLKKLADQYRTQKRGLMQKLLSGEWHFKNKDAA